MQTKKPRVARAGGAGREASGATALHNLFSFQVRRFNVLYSRTSALVYTREFGITLNEWRLLAELHDSPEPQMPFGRIVPQTGFDVGLASRTIDSLVNKELAVRLVDANDARLREIRLTRKGRLLGSRVLAVARSRNEKLLSRLSPAERAQLQRIMESLIDEARAMLEAQSAPE
mgnify:CR=1 FL=1